MTLASGQRIGQYEITARLGEGGMGEVYRAIDSKLKRPVALKVLPPLVAGDAERLARFRREAELLAALNHPNIAVLYGIEESSGVTALVMELVDGEDLSQRIARGPIELDEALAMAAQIGEALEAAHDQGIVHRDLKPANIKVRGDGTVKVLDFGLAKAITQSGERSDAPDLANSPTITSPAMTMRGVILGTAAYMSPEQARGKFVDRRTDIWAFGCVVYEMVTGHRAFAGDDVTEIMAAIVKEQPPFGRLPARCRSLVEACLQKDPRKRLQAISDSRFLLNDGSPSASLVGRPSTSRWITAVVAALALISTVALAGLAFVHFGERPPAERSMTLSVSVPAYVGFVAVSPDGTRMTLNYSAAGQRPQIHLRSLDSPQLQPLTGTTMARTPFWSPDSRSIGFFVDDALKTMPAAGGPAQVLCKGTGPGGGGTWGRNGVILLANDTGELRRVDANGGECAEVGKSTRAYSFPVYLPDGRHFLYFGRERNGSDHGVYLASLEEPIGQKVLPDRSSIVYVPSATDGRAHLVFLREGALMAQPFDVVNLQAVGDPFAVSRQALFSASPPQVAASASTDGTLVYLAGTDDTQLTWFDRNGKTIGVAGAPTTRQYAVTLSPDGHSVTTIRSTPAGPSELWLRDQVRGSVSRVATAGLTPIWAPDSSRIWFRTTVDNRQGLFQYELRSGVLDFIQAAGPELPQCRMSDWSRDGRFVICTRDDPKSGADIWSVPVESGKLDFKNAAQLVGSGATEGQGQLSPDRKWLAYTSNETGEEHVHVRSFPSGSSVFKVSVTSAMEPRWRSDGKELFFLTGTVGPVRLMSVSVGSGADGTLSLGEPQKLFDTNVRLSTIESNSWSYSPHPDGQRFLFNVMPDGRIPTVTVITRWLLPIANVSEH